MSLISDIDTDSNTVDNTGSDDSITVADTAAAAATSTVDDFSHVKFV